MKMSPATLRATCVRNTCDLLMSGMWGEWVENPFSYMPLSVLQDLLSCMWPAGSKLSGASIAPSRLLLTSGRLEHVDLPRGGDGGDYFTLLEMLSRGCRNLRSLSAFRTEATMDEELALPELLQNCTKLEHLHSSIYFHPNALNNCRSLKTIRLHFRREKTEFFCNRISSDLLKHLRSVEVFAFCHPSSDDPDWRPIVSAAFLILDNCPRLTSLGFLDSSWIPEESHEGDLRTLGTPRRFQLRRCYWNVSMKGSSDEEYCEKTRVAALSFPLVEALVIDVLDYDSLRYLKTLKYLTCLCIHFNGYIELNLRELYSLLEDIGPRLRHLGVNGIHLVNLDLNVVLRNCPNLSTLDLDCCSLTVDKLVQPCTNLLKLERLSVAVYKRGNSLDGVIFLLSNCLHLKLLRLNIHEFFCDGEMHAILRKNPFAELEVALIRSLSESGLRSFVQSTVTDFCLDSNLLSDDEVVRCVRGLNPSAVCHEDYFDLQEDLRIESCWL